MHALVNSLSVTRCSQYFFSLQKEKASRCRICSYKTVHTHMIGEHSEIAGRSSIWPGTNYICCRCSHSKHGQPQLRWQINKLLVVCVHYDHTLRNKGDEVCITFDKPAQRSCCDCGLLCTVSAGRRLFSPSIAHEATHRATRKDQSTAKLAACGKHAILAHHSKVAEGWPCLWPRHNMDNLLKLKHVNQSQPSALTSNCNRCM